MQDLQFTTKKWIIAHNGKDILHYRELEPNMVLTSGQPNIEVFDSYEDCAERIIVLGFNLDSVIPKKQSIEDAKLLAIAELLKYTDSK